MIEYRSICKGAGLLHKGKRTISRNKQIEMMQKELSMKKQWNHDSKYKQFRITQVHVIELH